MEVNMRVVCKDRKTTDVVGTLKKESTFLSLTAGITPSDAVYATVDKYLSEWSRLLVSDILSPKKK